MLRHFTVPLETDRQRERLAGTRLGELNARTSPFVREDCLESLAGWFTWAFVIEDCRTVPLRWWPTVTVAR
ncbi:hypothetical protein ACFXO9_02220 [Nocardia tengchongensis]|uniref:hypothetical protein n=1 Tax=Nocardia tengchongensis TaxID=2055889 RepID=UPI0036A2F4EB